MPKILLVDDDEQFRSMLSERLTLAGYEVQEAADGGKAIKLYESHPADVVIMDLIMPEKEGLETILEFKRLNFEAKIIAISGGGGGHGAKAYLKVATAFGAQRVLLKPFSNQEILETVRQVLQGIMLDITARERAVEGFRLLIEDAPSGMVVMDQTGHIVLLNAKIEEAFGYDRKELLSQPIDILAPKRFHDHRIFAIASLKFPPKGEWVQAATLYGLRKDGSEFPAEIRLNPLQTDQGVIIMATIIDITQRKRAEATLRGQE
jgi:PAS domain S-box-containing protein